MEDKGCFGCGCGCLSTLVVLGILLILGFCLLLVLVILGFDGHPQFHLQTGLDMLVALIQ